MKFICNEAISPVIAISDQMNLPSSSTTQIVGENPNRVHLQIRWHGGTNMPAFGGEFVTLSTGYLINSKINPLVFTGASARSAIYAATNSSAFVHVLEILEDTS